MKADREFVVQLTHRINEIIKRCTDEGSKDKLNKLLDDIIYSKKL